MHLENVTALLVEVLALPPSRSRLDADSPLLGSVPELDSMAVVNLIGALEDRFGITIDDDEIGASTFETVGALATFIAQKQAQ